DYYCMIWFNNGWLF
nr:immunoglobulin light chain junction region [Macaca mulatta]